MKLVPIKDDKPASKPATAKPNDKIAQVKPGQFYCPMGAEHVQDTPGDCPICGMRLDRLAGGRSTDESALPGLDAPGMVVVGTSGTAFAQLDPLLFMKTVKPNVIVVMDCANRMQRDANNDYYDQGIYTRTGATYETTLNVTGANTAVNYRRKYVNLRHMDTSLTTDKFEAGRVPFVPPGIAIVGDLQSNYSAFDSMTRLGIARVSLVRALQQNSTVARFGLVKMRQDSPNLGTIGNEGPVYNDDPDQASPTDWNR